MLIPEVNVLNTNTKNKASNTFNMSSHPIDRANMYSAAFNSGVLWMRLVVVSTIIEEHDAIVTMIMNQSRYGTSPNRSLQNSM